MGRAAQLKAPLQLHSLCLVLQPGLIRFNQSEPVGTSFDPSELVLTSLSQFELVLIGLVWFELV